MNQSPSTPGPLHQRPLRFPAMNGRLEPWDGLTERQQQECRQALCQMLVAVVRQLRDAVEDPRGLLDPRPEELTHD
jgi:hypothetical protein